METIKLDVSFHAYFSYTPEGAEYLKYKLHNNEAAIYKKDKSTRELVKSFPILHEPALKALSSFQELEVGRQREAVQFTELFRSRGLSARSPVAQEPSSSIQTGHAATEPSSLGAK